MAALLGALAVQVVLRVCAVAVFGKHGGHNMERNVSEVFRTVAPVTPLLKRDWKTMGLMSVAHWHNRRS